MQTKTSAQKHPRDSGPRHDRRLPGAALTLAAAQWCGMTVGGVCVAGWCSTVLNKLHNYLPNCTTPYPAI